MRTSRKSDGRRRAVAQAGSPRGARFFVCGMNTSPYKLYFRITAMLFRRDYSSITPPNEWWYYTGNLLSADGSLFGFELTFVRQAVVSHAAKNKVARCSLPSTSRIGSQGYISGGSRRSIHRAHQCSGPGIAGAERDPRTHLEWKNGKVAGRRGSALKPSPKVSEHIRRCLGKRPRVTSRRERQTAEKAEDPACASHYISLPSSGTNGSITLNGKMFAKGLRAGLDGPEFSRIRSARTKRGRWDWSAGSTRGPQRVSSSTFAAVDCASIDPFSAGTYVDGK